jgi:ADP-ribose pyrophosphatase
LSREETIKCRNIYNGLVLKLDVHEVVLENQKTAKREIITHQGGVGILPITDDEEIVLVKQYRKPFECETLEIPAGKKEKDEEPLTCAVRELKEETGITASSLTFLVDMYPSPGYTSETVQIYKAEGLKYGDVATDEDEFIEVFKYSMEEAVELIKSGKIKDAKTIIAVLMASDERLIQKLGQMNK